MRFYDLLLLCYPASFRNEYAEEMRPLFARRRRTARGLGTALLWLDTIADVIRNAAAAHLDLLRQDIAYTCRMAARSPGFFVAALLVVALGIGATTAAYSVTDFVLVRPLPFPDPDRLVKVWETTPGYSRMELSAPNYRDWKAAARSYASMGMYHGTQVTLLGLGEPRRLRGVAVSADLFPTLGVAPRIGRTFRAEDDRPGAPATVILSYRLWLSEFGGDAGVIGRSLVFDGTPHTVVGVMPREFNFPDGNAVIWTTTRFDEADYLD
jgi:putative ABC transport system permease protein